MQHVLTLLLQMKNLIQKYDSRGSFSVANSARQDSEHVSAGYAEGRHCCDPQFRGHSSVRGDGGAERARAAAVVHNVLAHVASVPRYEACHSRFANAGAVRVTCPPTGASETSHPRAARGTARCAVKPRVAAARSVFATNSLARARLQRAPRAFRRASRSHEPREARACAIVVAHAPATAGNAE
jgi:hypothetical protein